MCRSWAGHHETRIARTYPAPVPGPAWDPTAPVNDSEREQVSGELRLHFTAGRIDVDEFSSRLDAAWAASTAGELAAVVRDLPRDAYRPRPWERSGAAAQGGWAMPAPTRPVPSRHLMRRSANAHVRGFVTVMAFLIAIWALTGFGYFWPVWPLIFWGFVAFRHATFARRWEQRHYGPAA